MLSPSFQYPGKGPYQQYRAPSQLSQDNTPADVNKDFIAVLSSAFSNTPKQTYTPARKAITLGLCDYNPYMLRELYKK